MTVIHGIDLDLDLDPHQRLNDTSTFGLRLTAESPDDIVMLAEVALLEPLGAIVTDHQTALHRGPAADPAFLDAQCLKLRLDAGHVSRVTLFMASDDRNDRAACAGQCRHWAVRGDRVRAAG